ncbi:MAG: hypothetical protein OEN01_08890 [Candidatus Krumholzibacteria bacterium]|nr:hypothetical protein [Candidatus Krumholzibacteria bacterium]
MKKQYMGGTRKRGTLIVDRSSLACNSVTEAKSAATPLSRPIIFFMTELLHGFSD